LGLALGYPAGEYREIGLRWCRQLIFWLVERGWWIGRVTLDGYQSVDTIQTLERPRSSAPHAPEARRKIARQYSLDRTTEGYDTLKSLGEQPGLLSLG